ncbi:hypothetical protein SAMN05192558_106280 [Actinokineospora alba]|uniref:DUF4878 domain-containing protein n=1 Tax=Actinokineospora alba TaxID=504798 RepID=A0A1H0PUM3_9PSEU|nr:hypothetical protein [Actinokineospora alba]TDP65955.1 hypothetical protein C8E96_1447 [Actinokineospora alba]SDI61388.1 hypothetical protein SAMN05421871_106172 [Actinokineospora alba]SDP08851.1 hypothetical protein SAMN05192558_106280 [Actinokineospora alba]
MQSRRNAFIAAGCAVALLIACVIAIGQVNDSRGPAQAVREYVDLIARGDATAANALVDPGPDRAFLTDEVLAGSQRIKVTEVSGDDSGVEPGQTAVATVRYELPGHSYSADLRVKREPNSFGGLEQWRVIDPLVVPVVVQTNVPTLDSGSLGAAKIPVSGPRLNGFPQRRFLMYPASYQLTGMTSKYVRALPQAVSVAHGQSMEMNPAAIGYQPEQELFRLATAKIDELLARCLGTGAMPPADCPRYLRPYAEGATDFRLDRSPPIERLQVYQTEYKADGTTKPAIHFATTQGQFSFNDGRTRSTDFTIRGLVDISRDDAVTVTFEDDD